MKRLLMTAAAALALSACATRTEPPGEWVRNTRSLTTPPPELRIVADAASIDTSAFEVDDRERARFNRERSRSMNAGRHDDLKYVNGPIGLILLPVLIPVLIIDHVATEASAETFRPKLIPAEEGAQLAALFRERATGAAIAERTSRLLPSRQDERSPQLVVRMKTAEYASFPGDEFSITLGAEAYVRSAAGEESPRTAHFVMLKRRPIEMWSDQDYSKQEIDRALDILAVSIGATYRPDSVSRPKERVEHWGD